VRKFVERLIGILAIIGLACILKHIMHCEEGCCLCSCCNCSEKDEKTSRTDSSFKIKLD